MIEKNEDYIEKSKVALKTMAAKRNNFTPHYGVEMRVS